MPLGIASVLAYVPYHKAFIPAFGFASQANGIAPVEGNGTMPFHALIFWGPLAILCRPLRRSAARRLPEAASLAAQRVAGAPCPALAVVVSGSSGCWPAATWARRSPTAAAPGSPPSSSSSLLTLFVATLRREIEAYADGKSSLPIVVALIAGSLAALLILGAEFFFIKDVFNDRMNTVFKFYYQAWMFLAIGGGFALYYMVSHWLREDHLPAGAIPGRARQSSSLLPASPIPSAPPSPAPTTSAPSGPSTASPSSEVQRRLQRRPVAIKQRQTADVIVETVGNQAIGWEWGSTGRIASWTGLSTVFAWPGHEQQWRGGMAAATIYQRPVWSDVDTLYKTDRRRPRSEQIVAKYGIRLHRRRLARAAGLLSGRAGQVRRHVSESRPPVSGDTVIYKCRNESSGLRVGDGVEQRARFPVY